jgi:hypothetical protein
MRTQGCRWVAPELNTFYFPVVGSGIVSFECILFNMNCDIGSQDVIAKILAIDFQDPWRPAGIEHLLAFNDVFRGQWSADPIVALGSSSKIRDEYRVPYVERVNSECEVNLYWFDSIWRENCHFLAVREI